MSKQAEKSTEKVKTLRDLADWLERGATPRDRLVIGTEHEKFVFNRASHKPAEFSGEKGLEKLLEKLTDKGWAPVDEAGRVIELRKDTASVSLEPSGQLEHSTPVYQSLHDIASEIENQISDAVDTAGGIDLDLVALGYHPIETPDTLPRIPKTRYENFDACMAGLDGASKNAMHVLYSTAATQASIGFENEQDMVKKLRVALSLQPIVTALFANSPFQGGKLSGLKSTRSHIIHNAVNGRYGFMLPVAFEDGFGFERFAAYALNEMPLIGVYQDGRFVNAGGARFTDFMAGKLNICPGREATGDDWENHLNCIWPEVRLRRFLEMRGADSGPEEMIKALPALWVGLTYDAAALDQAYEMVKDWSDEDREYLRLNVPVHGLETSFLGTDLREIAQNMLKLAQMGLDNRNILNAKGENEAGLLEPLHEIAQSGQSWADRLIHLYKNEWKSDISPLFNQMSYKNRPSVLTYASSARSYNNGRALPKF